MLSSNDILKIDEEKDKHIYCTRGYGVFLYELPLRHHLYVLVSVAILVKIRFWILFTTPFIFNPSYKERTNMALFFRIKSLQMKIKTY